MKSNFDKKLIGSLSLGDVIHFAIAVITFAAISWFYFYPNDVNGDVLQQHDIMQGAANSQETTAFQEQTGEKSWWTDALFGACIGALSSLFPHTRELDFPAHAGLLPAHAGL